MSGGAHVPSVLTVAGMSDSSLAFMVASLRLLYLIVKRWTSHSARTSIAPPRASRTLPGYSMIPKSRWPICRSLPWWICRLVWRGDGREHPLVQGQIPTFKLWQIRPVSCVQFRAPRNPNDYLSILFLSEILMTFEAADRYLTALPSKGTQWFFAGVRVLLRHRPLQDVSCPNL